MKNCFPFTKCFDKQNVLSCFRGNNLYVNCTNNCKGHVVYLFMFFFHKSQQKPLFTIIKRYNSVYKKSKV